MGDKEDAASVEIHDDALVEIDDETQAKLDKAGITIEDQTETPATEEETQEVDGSETAPIEEHPLSEPAVEEEQPLIFGKYKTIEEAERGYTEAVGKLTQTSQQLSQAQEARALVNQLMQRPDGQQALMAVASGQPYQQPQPKPTVEIPNDPTEFYDWLGQSPNNMATYIQHQNRPLVEENQGLKQTVGSILGYLEQQVVKEKYGDQLKELAPFLEQVDQELGPNAQYYQVEHRMRMARGLQAEQAMSQQTQQTQQKQVEQEQMDRHRQKVMAETVETANTTAKPGKVIDFNKMTAKQMRAAILQMDGAKYQPSD